jgi:hypothetical protein
MNIQNIKDYSYHSDEIGDIYMGEMNYYSITLDIIALYLKGQKLLYVEAKTVSEQYLNKLMLPVIFISAVCTVLSVAIKGYTVGPILVSSLTGLNSFLLAVINYLKLDAKAEAHKTTAYQFDKLQTTCEFYSGKAFLIGDPEIKKKVSDFVDSLEKRVIEIKDINQFIIPDIVRHTFALIYSYNVFAIMKKYKAIKLAHTQRLINVNNEIERRSRSPVIVEIDSSPVQKNKKHTGLFGNIKSFWTKESNTHDDCNPVEINIYSKETSEEDLLNERDSLIAKIIEYRNVSIEMNEIFNDVIKKNTDKRNKSFVNCFLNWFKNF